MIQRRQQWRLATTRTTMATAQRATARRATTTIMIATSEDNDKDGVGATGDDAMGYDDNDDDGGGTTGDEVDNYGKGATGDDKDDKATAQRDATIKSRRQRQRVATIGATTTRTMTTAPARIARRECGRSVGGRRRS